MALRRPCTIGLLLAGVLIIPTVALAAPPSVPAKSDIGAAVAPEVQAVWTDRVRIDGGPGTTIRRTRPADAVLRIVTQEDSKSLNPTGLGKIFGDSRPDYGRRDNLPGTTIDSQESPAITLMPLMANILLGTYFRNVPDAVPAQNSVLRFASDEWALVHQGNQRNNPLYRLNHRTVIEQRRTDGTLADLTSCSNNDRRATLDEWQANDYALLKQAAQVIAMDCMGQLAKKVRTFYPRPLATADLSGYAEDAVPPARVRIFGSAGRGITMYTDAACKDDYREKIEVKRPPPGGFAGIGGLFAGTPDNIAIGIPETATVRNMENMHNAPNYQEYEVAGGKPLIFEAGMETNNASWCSSRMSSQFIAKPGQDYEVEMEVANKMCRLHIREVQADGSLVPQQIRPTPSLCSRSD